MNLIQAGKKILDGSVGWPKGITAALAQELKDKAATPEYCVKALGLLVKNPDMRHFPKKKVAPSKELVAAAKTDAVKGWIAELKA